MNEKPRRNRNKPKKPSRATVAARDPKPGAVNRPGFDLGGAVGDAKSDDMSRIKGSKVRAQDAVEERVSTATGGSQIKAEGKAEKVTSKMQSAVAGVRNWLRRK